MTGAPPASIGHGHRLPAAFEKLSALPALAESRNRLLRVLLGEAPSPGDLVRAIESDLALVVAVMRVANNLKPGEVGSVPKAVEVLSPDGVSVLAKRIAVVDFFERTPGWSVPTDHLRLHGVSVQALADRIARETGYRKRDELRVASVLHDIGKLILMEAYDGYPDVVHAGAVHPEARLAAERRELGLDHALVGGVLIRRWRLPREIARAVELHHGPTGDPMAAIVRLADLLTHYLQGREVKSSELIEAAREATLDPDALRSLMYEPIFQGTPPETNHGPSPLSKQQTQVLKGLSAGKVYKEIATDMGVAPSTVRTHLHALYTKLGVRDRAQAVLLARERGWI